MNSLQNFNYNGTVIQRRNDGFVNLTQMCQANGKRIDHWKELKATKAYIAALQANYPELRVVYPAHCSISFRCLGRRGIPTLKGREDVNESDRQLSLGE